MARPTAVPDPTPGALSLRPGVRVTRRDDGHLQVGLDPDLAVTLDDSPETRAVLSELRAGTAPPAPAHPVHRALEARGLLVATAALRTDLARADDLSPVAAAYAQAGDHAHALLAERRRRPVTVEARDLPDPLRVLLEEGVRRSGLVTDGPAYAVLLVAVGEFDRDRVDVLVRAETPHLLVLADERGFRVGPFVTPGLTACLRCVDARLGESDPRRGLVAEQYARSGPMRADGVPHPIDPALATVALGWAVRDLVSYVDGAEPATWSTSVQVRADLRVARTVWPRHPRCGCAWAATG